MTTYLCVGGLERRCDVERVAIGMNLGVSSCKYTKLNVSESCAASVDLEGGQNDK